MAAEIADWKGGAEREYCVGPHRWGDWQIVEYTGDWFHPHVVRRWCKICPARETDER